MKQEIYFSDQAASKNLSWYFIRLISHTYLTVAPKKANAKFRKLLTTPKKYRGKFIPQDMQETTIKASFGSLVVYTIGAGPAILFVHGWSGGGQQFFKLMHKISQSGFQAVSFDHYSHGQSDYHESNLPLLINATETVSNYVGKTTELAAVVSHSLGCVASLNAFAQSQLPQILISPLLNFFEALHLQVEKSGLPKKVLTQLLLDIEKEHNVKLASLDIITRIEHYRGSIKLIHDSLDKYSDHQLSLNLANRLPKIALHSTNGLGHTSILYDHDTHTFVRTILGQLCQRPSLR